MGDEQDTDAFVRRLDDIARASVLLVTCDFDGTIAALAPHPADVVPEREALVALRALAAMPHTHVLLLSGRALADLAERAGPLDGVHLVGSHGSEFEPDFAGKLDASQTALREQVRRDLHEIAKRDEGLMVEEKPSGAALHYRNATDAAARIAVNEVRNGPAQLKGIYVKDGKKVIELSVVSTNKGLALSAIRQRFGATAALFLGDDQTDEDAFATLRGPDVGVKVGDGATRAAFRIADPMEAAKLLARVALTRDAWIRG